MSDDSSLASLLGHLELYSLIPIRVHASRVLPDHVDYQAFVPADGALDLRGDISVVRDGNVMIVGDAVGLASVDMGEGIGPAVRSAILAADAITRNTEYDLGKLAKFSVPGFFRSRGISRSA